MKESADSRFIPLSDTEEMFAVAIHVLDRFQSEVDLVDWLKRATRTVPGDIVQGTLGADLILDLYEIDDPLSVVLRAHLYLEAFIDALLTRRLKHPEIILRNRDFTFAMKLDLLRAANRVDARLFDDIKRINTLRNRFAHNLRFSIADFDMSAFTYCSDVKEVSVRLKTTEARVLLNVYVFKLVSYYLLIRLTMRHPFIADVR